MGTTKDKIKSPLTKGVAKVPVVMQMEALECGAASLTMILAYYGKWIPLEQVRADCGVSRDGSNAKNVLKAARSYGLVAKGYRYEPDELKKNGKFPCIIHWNFNHFVVLNGFKGNKAVLNDPAKGTYSVPMETFDNSFTGICLMFEPSENFQPGGKPKSMLAFAKEKMKGVGVAVVFTIVTTVISSLIGIINPAFSRIFIDSKTETEKKGNAAVQFYCTSPLDSEKIAESVYMKMINGARKYLYIFTPYLIIDDNILSALELSAKSGVDVRIITPGVGDKKFVHLTTRSYYRDLISAGVKIYEYKEGFVHSKTFVSDDEITTVGTVNLDYRSLYLHFECGAVIYGKEGAECAKNDFLKTVEISKEISLDDCKDSWRIRRLKNIYRLFAPLM